MAEKRFTITSSRRASWVVWGVSSLLEVIVRFTLHAWDLVVLIAIVAMACVTMLDRRSA